MKQALLFWLLTFASVSVFAQQHENVAKGFAADQVYHFNGLDQINLFNTSLNVSAPIGQSFHVGGGPINYSLALHYSGNNWGTVTNEGVRWNTEHSMWEQVFYATHVPFQYNSASEINWNAGMGWNLSLGKLIPPGQDPCVCWVYESEDGAKHDFFSTLHETNTNEVANSPLDVSRDTPIMYTSDNTYLRMTKVYTDEPGGRMARFREIEFPDGTIRRFSTAGDLVEIRDRFLNKVTVTSITAQQDGTFLQTLDDGIRQTRITYIRIDTPGTAAFVTSLFLLVKSIDQPAFNTTTSGPAPRAITTFHYGVDANNIISYAPGALDGAALISRRFPDRAPQDCRVGITPSVQVPILTSVTLPDGTSFEMRYDLGDNGVSFNKNGTDADTQTCVDAAHPMGQWAVKAGFSGNLTSLRLPTLGSIEWDYHTIAFPAEGAVSHYRMEDDYNLIAVKELVLSSSAGVRERRERAPDGTLLSRKTYESRYYKRATNDTAYALLTTLKSWTGFDAAGNGGSVVSRNVNYFSVGVDAGGYAHTGEYSLPFTRYPFSPANGNLDPEAAPSANARYTEADPVVSVENADPTDQNRFISSKLYSGSRRLLQYKYVRYEADDPPMSGGAQSDRRLLSERTVWTDANSNFLTDEITTYSDFDGLGHYRTTTQSGSGYDATSTRKTTVAFNRADTDVGGNVFDSGFYECSSGPSTTFTMPDAGHLAADPPVAPQPWILGMYTSESMEEGTQTAKTLFRFDRDTGFLGVKRVLSGATPAPDDVVTTYSADLVGNILAEQFFGASRANIPATPLDSISLDPPTIDIRHDYRYGSLWRTYYIDSATHALASPFLVNHVIDLTGLPKSSLDPSDLLTSYSYDPMGRLTQVSPPGEAATTYTYSAASFAGNQFTPAKVNIQRSVASGNVAEAEFQYDSLGRLSKQLERTAAGTYAARTTRYDGVGHVRDVSEWDLDTVAPTHWTTTTYDALGRPLTILAPDGHQITLAYTANRSIQRSTGIRTNAILGETTQSTTELYDRFGRLIRLREGSGPFGALADTTYTYDVGNRLATVAATHTPVTGSSTNQKRKFVYDNRGFLLSASSPEKGVDAAGEPNSVLYSGYDARGHATRVVDGPSDLSYTFDVAERLTKVSDAGGDLKTFAFGAANLPSGCTTTCTDFTKGKLVTAVRSQNDPGLGGNVSVTENYHYYRASGRVSDRQTTISGTATFPGATFNTYQDYDALGNVQIVGYPGCAAPAACAAVTPARPSNTAYYSYQNGWLTFVGSDGPAYASLTYQPSGLLNTVTHANGVSETWIADPSGLPRPCGIYATGKGTHLSTDNAAPCRRSIAFDTGSTTGVQWTTGQYTYDGAGNVKQIGGRQYVYDPANRLVTESESGTVPTGTFRYSTDYLYDTFGNMTQQSLVRQSISS
ncbi:MAG: hypothetical protein JWO56_475, partial [Acidobacteria bacterium]|nr:hypothetical protein [Acidobacteriota bacterium]